MTEPSDVIGVFIGLQHSSYEYIANIIAPYKTQFDIDIGSFILVSDPPNNLVARVIDFVPQGELVSFMGQKWLSDVALESDSAIGSDIKKRKISYSVKIKVLGTLDSSGVFNPGLRRIPHITSKVVKPDEKTLGGIVNTALKEQEHGVKIGVYYLNQKLDIKFNLSQLDSKRTFVFARAGYGKSNLMKLIACDWNPNFGSLVIFDPEGEYAFTDKNNRPGIMDKKEALLITSSTRHQETKNIYGKTKFNLKDFDPKFILPIIVSPEKYTTMFFPKLMGLNKEGWGRLVDLLYTKRWQTPLDEIRTIVVGQDGTWVEEQILPVLNNLIPPIRDLHDPESHLIPVIKAAMKKGAVIIFDTSAMDSVSALRMSSVIVKNVLHENQQNFKIGSEENLLKVTFAVDEAQTVLASDSAASDAFVKLAKEGRKYSLGGIFITQQPSSVPFEILSQGDNFFAFHLLSKGDLDSLQRANAHYSDDIVTQILNEPKPGKCYMWTSSQPFVLPVQILKYEDLVLPNKSKEVQDSSTLLTDITKEIIDDINDPVFKRIIGKYQKIEEENEDKDVKYKTRLLFDQLDEDEKKCLRTRSAIQSGPTGEFAVTYKFYNETLALFNVTDDSA